MITPKRYMKVFSIDNITRFNCPTCCEVDPCRTLLLFIHGTRCKKCYDKGYLSWIEYILGELQDGL